MHFVGKLIGFQMSLSRLYQSLGMFEQILALFDELDATLSLIALHHSSEGKIHHRNSVNLKKECPSNLNNLKFGKY